MGGDVLRLGRFMSYRPAPLGWARFQSERSGCSWVAMSKRLFHHLVHALLVVFNACAPRPCLQMRVCLHGVGNVPGAWWCIWSVNGHDPGRTGWCWLPTKLVDSLGSSMLVLRSQAQRRRPFIDCLHARAVSRLVIEEVVTGVLKALHDGLVLVALRNIPGPAAWRGWRCRSCMKPPSSLMRSSRAEVAFRQRAPGRCRA